jgi:transposase-like protein
MGIQSAGKVMLRYSDAFKQKVVNEIERGRLTISQASRLYEIYGTNTIYKWLRKYGKNDLIRKVVRIEMKDEKSILKQKEERIRELESALSSLTLHNICLQTYVDVVNENISEEEKKTSLSKLSPEQRRVLERLLSRRP